MKMKMDYIADSGLETERIEFTVLEDCNLMYFLVSDSNYRHEKYISNQVMQTHWFQPCDVKQNDHVILYSCKGQDTVQRKGHNVIYTFYRNLETPVWASRDAAVLFELSGWRTLHKETLPPAPRKNWFKALFSKKTVKKQKPVVTPS